MKIKIPENIDIALNLIEQRGKEAYVVGGCVRDFLMNKQPVDWDVTTNALPNEIKDIFSSYRTIDTGIKHGTVTVVINGEGIEITTYRIDGEYSDNRHPDSVAFTEDIVNDLSRRDFTVNAMAYSPKRGFVDPFGGINDIENKLLKCVGDADKRFNEDALRIMRCIRFASVLDFTIESETRKSAIRNMHLLESIAKERLSSELLKLLCGKNVLSVLENYRDIIGVFIPELKCEFDFKQYGKKHAYTVWGHTCHTVANIENDPVLRLTMLLHDCGKPATHKLDENGNSTFKNHGKVGGEIAKAVLTDLKMSKNMINTVSFLVSYHDLKVPDSRVKVKEYLNLLGKEKFLMLMKIRKADRSGLSEEYRDIAQSLSFAYEQYDDIIRTNEAYSIDMLDINGDDLLKLGIKGKSIKNAFEIILALVVENPCLNKKSIITEKIKKGEILNENYS